MRDFNFFAPYQQKQSSTNINIKSFGFISALLIIIVAGISVGLFASDKMLAAKVAGARNELKELQASPEYEAAQALQKEINDIDRYDASAELALEKIDKGRMIQTKFMTQLASVLPENAIILSMDLTKTYANFRFEIPSLAAAAELVDSLDQSGLFVHTSLASVENTRELGYEAEIFTIMKAGE